MRARVFALRLLLLAGAGFLASSDVQGAELRSETLDAFNRYVRVTERRMDAEVRGEAAFLWADRLPAAERQTVHRRLAQGEIVVGRLASNEAGRKIETPGGLIHHWVGTVFVPHATAARTAALMQAYEHYQEVYAPNVRRSRTLERDGDRFRVHLQLFVKKIIGVVLNSEYDVRYAHLSSSRVHVRSYSTRIAEVRDPGTPAEAEAPVGKDSGYLWRFNNYCSLEERGGGTFVQCESLSLSRGIPPGLGWLVGPFVTSIPRESLEFTLDRMRTALTTGSRPKA
jgi:hypothetical protein